MRTVRAVVVLLGAVLFGCEAESAVGSASDVAPAPETRSGTATLAMDEGLVLSTGEVIPACAFDNSVVPCAGTRNSDIMSFKFSDTVKLEAGTPDGAMRTMKDAGGRNTTVASLADVPDEVPGASEHDMVIDPEPGNAFVVKGNVTNGHARVRVTAYDAVAHEVMIEYAVTYLP